MYSHQRSVDRFSFLSDSASRSLGAAIALVLYSSASFSQSTPSTEGDVLSEIVVTGSRIRGVAPTGSDLITLDREVAIQSGALTPSELLRQAPQVSNLGATETPSTVQNGPANVSRGSGVNLRGIGPHATLTLIDGRRLPTAGSRSTFVDPSVVPTIALERLEVVADGASALYGSDAIAGVVNLITRRDFEGVEFNGRYGVGDDYDLNQYGAIFGQPWSTGHLMIAAEHSERSNLHGSDRDFYTSDLRSRGGRDQRSDICSPGTVTAGGVTYPIPAGQNGANLLPSDLVAGPANRCDDVKFTDILPEQSRNSALLSFKQELGGLVTLHLDGLYSKREFESSGGAFGSVGALTVTVPATNAFNRFGAPVSVKYSLLDELGEKEVGGFAEVYSGTIGTEVRLPGSWRGDLSYTYGMSKDVSEDFHRTNNGALNAALADSNPATALNVFGDGANNNPATLAAISNSLFLIGGENEIKSTQLQFDGPLFALPGGEVRLAVGGEYRDEGIDSGVTVGTLAAPLRLGNATERHLAAYYAEAFVPIVGSPNAVPGIQRLDLSLAGRYEDYSDFGTTTNPKYGVTWEPLKGLLVRGSYGTSFRAPSLVEADPLSAGAGWYPGNFLDPTSPTGFTTGMSLAGGNPDNEPEEATTWTFGFELKPEQLPGLSVGLTYFAIDYEQQISGLQGDNTILQREAFFSEYITRNPTPQEVLALLASGYPNNGVNPASASLIKVVVDARSKNLGTTKLRGIDFNVSYPWTTGFGEFFAGVNGSYLTSMEAAPSPTAPLVDVLNQINYPSKFRARGNLSWSQGPVNVASFLNYVGSYDNNLVAPVQTVGSWTTVDLNVTYDVGSVVSSLEGLTLGLNLLNALDKDPPFVNNSPGYDAQVATATGRQVSLIVGMRW
jgi:iron complex outermembrane receptor protein